jgi:hypothetical protein
MVIQLHHRQNHRRRMLPMRRVSAVGIAELFCDRVRLLYHRARCVVRRLFVAVSVHPVLATSGLDVWLREARCREAKRRDTG